jgi:hypothetical protein
MIRLKLDFALTKTGSRMVATSEEAATGPVRNEAGKLSLRALLHYLWYQGGLTEWTARWAGKRHWWQARNHLMEAAATITVKGGGLADRLFVPEPFRADDKAAIELRRATALADIHMTSAPQKLMLLVGEVKDFATARSGRRIIIKHMPDFPLMLEDSSFRRLQARYKAAFELWEANQALHLIAIATFGAAASGVVSVEEIALMTATEQWIPIESVYEERLVQRLARLSLKSVKGLRFDLPANVPVASATLPQHCPLPVALYIVPPAADDAFETMLAGMISARPDMEPWVWRVASGDMPDLPVA